MPVQTSCEHCGFSFVVKADMAGKEVRCPNCGQSFAAKLTNTDQPAPGSAMPPDTAFTPIAEHLPFPLCTGTG